MGIRMQGHVYVLDTLLNYWKKLLYLLVSTRAVIGQFSGPYSPVRPAKLFCDLSPTFLNFYNK